MAQFSIWSAYAHLPFFHAKMIFALYILLEDWYMNFIRHIFYLVSLIFLLEKGEKF